MFVKSSEATVRVMIVLMAEATLPQLRYCSMLDVVNYLSQTSHFVFFQPGTALRTRTKAAR